MLKVTCPQTAFFSFLVIVLGWLSMPSKVFCQKSMMDSLKYLLTTSKEDTGRVDILNDLSAEYIDSFKLVEAKQFANEAFFLAQKIGDKTGEGVALMNLGNAFAEEGNSEDAIKYFEQALRIRQVLKSKKGMAECYNNIGIRLWRQGQFFEALKNHNLALSIREGIKDTVGMAFSYQNIGNVFIQIGKYPEAVQSFLPSLTYFGVKKDSKMMAIVQNSLGAVYCELKEYQKAIQSHEESLRLSSDEKVSADAISNIGNAYFRQKKFEEALKHYFRALKIREQYSDVDGIAISLLNIGATYQGQNKHREALESIFKSLEISLRIDNPVFISAAYLNIGISYGFQKKYAQARSSINKSLALASEISMLEFVREGYRELTNLDSIQGDWEGAFSNYKSYILIRDSMINEGKTGEIKYLTFKYETDIEKEKTQIENAKEIEIANERTKIQRNWWIFGVTILGLLGGFFFYNFKKRRDRELEEKVRTTRQEALNAQMSGHFISNTVDSIMGFIESNDKKKAIDYLLLFHRLIRRVLENSFQKLVPLEAEFGVLKDYFELERLRFKENSLSLELNIDDEIDPQNTLIPPMIFQTLVENSIKHGFKKSQGGVIKVSIKENLKSLECAVEDNGIGRRASALSRSEEDDGKTSYGSSLAEKLVSVAGGLKGKTSFQVVDLVDPVGIPRGTRTEFGFLKISN